MSFFFNSWSSTYSCSWRFYDTAPNALSSALHASIDVVQPIMYENTSSVREERIQDNSSWSCLNHEVYSGLTRVSFGFVEETIVGGGVGEPSISLVILWKLRRGTNWVFHARKFLGVSLMAKVLVVETEDVAEAEEIGTIWAAMFLFTRALIPCDETEEKRIVCFVLYFTYNRNWYRAVYILRYKREKKIGTRITNKINTDHSRIKIMVIEL